MLLFSVLVGGLLLLWLAGWLGADLSQTAANVVPVGTYQLTSGAKSGNIAANIAITAGMPIYSDGTYWYAAGSGGNALQAGSTSIAIALNSAPGVNQPVTGILTGTVNLGATLVGGQTYVLSATGGASPGGKIAPISDLTTNNYVTILGTAKDTANLAICTGGVFASSALHA
jgi:hypothetical protein